MSTTANTKTRTPQRRSHAERKEATRKKILEATLVCLAKYGYAGTRVSQVVEKAGVSRGAWSHHFPSMNAMYLEAAEYLTTKVYDRVGVLIQGLRNSEDPLNGLVSSIWKEFFDSDVNKVYLELLVASRQDAELAKTLKTNAEHLERSLTIITEQYFAPKPEAVDGVAHMMVLTRWVLRGMALDAHLLPDGAIETGLDTWHKLLATQMQIK